MQRCYYQLLEELGEGDANQLAHDRPANERRNAIILELVNGPGYYMKEPDYDWAFAVVRNYFYTQAKAIKIQSLQLSSYEPLAEVATKSANGTLLSSNALENMVRSTVRVRP